MTPAAHVTEMCVGREPLETAGAARFARHAGDHSRLRRARCGDGQGQSCEFAFLLTTHRDTTQESSPTSGRSLFFPCRDDMPRSVRCERSFHFGLGPEPAIPTQRASYCLVSVCRRVALLGLSVRPRLVSRSASAASLRVSSSNWAHMFGFVALPLASFGNLSGLLPDSHGASE
jgi:hypothetical protein